MAVDSRDKRMSMINIGACDLMMGNPVNGVSATDRAMLLNLYGGITLSSAGSFVPYYYLVLLTGGDK